jgi:glycogen operon protein
VKIRPGQHYTLGASWDGQGVNFAVYSENATRIELCLFDSKEDERESQRLVLPEYDDHVWHGYVSGIRPGQLYGYRAYGPYKPQLGHRFNPCKLLVDPYTRAVVRSKNRWHDEMFGYKVGHPKADLSLDTRDNAALAPLSVVVEPAFSWGDDRPPRTPWNQTVIYELHVRGMTRLHALVPEALRGTYAGLASDPVLEHLKELGVTAVELMPVHYPAYERHLTEKGLRNYWAYNTLAFFAPNPEYAINHSPQDVLREFKSMVARFHSAGIEVILDVVYNHTGEGNHLGPTACLRGLDNASYYRLLADNPRYYLDFTGCGNTLNTTNPRVLQLIMDSLRYWVQEMRIDGFRFDLASSLARESYEVDRLGAFFDIIQQDPVLNRIKLIAEPWDLGEGGYQVGNFPVLWKEWNGQYRDTVRRFWKGDSGQAPALASRLCGSSDLYQEGGRRPQASINFITCHDGFTLHDLVSYNEKHNLANGEQNRDGESHNNSWNCGHEGPSDDPEIRALRERQKRNLLATLFLSQGVPMLCAGDEMGRTQRGNNNAYCQDNPISWLSWELDEEQTALLRFTRRLIALRRTQPLLRRRRFFPPRPPRGQLRNIVWYEPRGSEMTDKAWNQDFVRCLGVWVSGRPQDEIDEQGDPVVGDHLLLLLNAHCDPIEFRLASPQLVPSWTLLLDTARPEEPAHKYRSGARYPLQGRSVVVLGAPS